MANHFIFIFSVIIIHFKVCWGIKAVDDDLLLVIPRSQSIPEDSKEINETFVEDYSLFTDQNIIKNKFRIRLTFKPHDFTSHNHSTLKLNYTLDTRHQFLELHQYNLQQNSSESSSNSSVVPTLVAPCLNVSTTFYKNCFRLEQKRIQLSERQAKLIRWRKDVKVFASQLNRRRSNIARKEMKISEREKEFNDNVLFIHNSKIELLKTQNQLKKDRKKIKVKKFQLREKVAKLKAYERELKNNMTNLLDLLAPVSNETIEIQANYSNLTSSISHKNASYCDLKINIFDNDDRYLELCQWSERLNTKIRELIKEQKEFDEYKLAMVNDKILQLRKMAIDSQKSKKEPLNQGQQVQADN